MALRVAAMTRAVLRSMRRVRVPRRWSVTLAHPHANPCLLMGNPPAGPQIVWALTERTAVQRAIGARVAAYPRLLSIFYRVVDVHRARAQR